MDTFGLANRVLLHKVLGAWIGASHAPKHGLNMLHIALGPNHCQFDSVYHSWSFLFQTKPPPLFLVSGSKISWVCHRLITCATLFRQVAV